MTLKLATQDKALIDFIGLYKMATVSQLAVLSNRSSQVIRRRSRALKDRGLISFTQRIYGNKRGRPEAVIVLTKEGKRLFFEQQGICLKDKNFESNTIDFGPIEHELLVNWFLIHLKQLEKERSEMGVDWVTLNSSIFKKAADQHSVNIKERMTKKDGSSKDIEFIPDAVFAIKHMELKKSLLFFLEVDRGTENIASPDRSSNDIRQKINNYQLLFHSGRYKRYEKIFDDKFNGFRLLLLAHTETRLTSLCRLVQEMPPSDFIWATHQEQMFSDGLFHNIWYRGGKKDDAPQSILGNKLACRITLKDKM